MMGHIRRLCRKNRQGKDGQVVMNFDRKLVHIRGASQRDEKSAAARFDMEAT
jgi:hypothetical protein